LTFDIVQMFAERNAELAPKGQWLAYESNELHSVLTRRPRAELRHRARGRVARVETSYSFSSYEKLLADFWADVDAWRQRR